ncbi:MAG: hypothetical protein V3R16_02580 [Nitrospirales bacterium]
MNQWLWGTIIVVTITATGCVTPPPRVIELQKPDIVEIDIPVPVMGPFGCDCRCECEPNKDLKIELEDDNGSSTLGTIEGTKRKEFNVYP